eukprot:g26269.t1
MEPPCQDIFAPLVQGVEEHLQDCLELVDWTVFMNSAENLDAYTTRVMDFMNKYVEDCVPKKSIRVFPNRKPWINWEIHCLLKTSRVAFKSDDPNVYRKSRYDLRKAIRDANRQYWTKLEAQTNHTDSRCLWQGLHSMTGYKVKANASGAVSPAPTAPDTPVPSVTSADVRSVFLGVNLRKATGPDGDPRHAFRACAIQMAEVFTDIFNFSLLQAEDPTCFKKTTIIPRLVMAHINSSLPACLDPLQFAYRRNRSTAITSSPALHSSLKHLDNKDTTSDSCSLTTAPPSTPLSQDLGRKEENMPPFTSMELRLTWYGNCSAYDCEKLQKVVCTAQTITEANLP